MNDFQGTNFKYGIGLDILDQTALGDARFIQGARHEITFAPIAAATIPTIFFIAPKACKVISAVERHVTVAGQAGTMQIEKVPSGTAIGSGTELLASAFDLTSTANTNVTKTSTGTLAKGDSLAGKVASGAATSYAGGVVTVTIEWL